MSGNYIIDLHQDRAGDLWMSTYMDVVRRMPRPERFRSLRSETA